MELGPQNHNGDGLLGPNSIIVVYMDPLGKRAQHGQQRGVATSPRLHLLGLYAVALTPKQDDKIISSPKGIDQKTRNPKPLNP